MSHFTRVRTEMTDRHLVIEALEEMGHQIQEGGRVRGWNGQQETADLVVRQSNGYDIGLRQTPSGSFEVVADWMGAGDQEAFTRRLRQEYAAAAAIAQVRSQGFTDVRRKRTEDGEIEIVVHESST